MDESGYDVRRALMNKPIQQDKDEKGGRDSKNRGKAEQMKKEERFLKNIMKMVLCQSGNH